MTDANIADRVYIEPLTPEFLEEVISKERPDGLLATLGGQAGLNLAVTLAEQGAVSYTHLDVYKRQRLYLQVMVMMLFAEVMAVTCYLVVMGMTSFMAEMVMTI